MSYVNEKKEAEATGQSPVVVNSPIGARSPERSLSPDKRRHIHDGHHVVEARNSVELADQAALASCGYKQEFKREFGLFSTFSVSFSVLGILPSVASTLGYTILYSGTAGCTWGWLLAWTGIQSVAMSMAELSSSMPTSGGLYYCVAVLAPPRWSPFLSYLTGWSNWLGLVAGSPSVNYGNASMIIAMASVYNPNFNDSNALRFGISVALTAGCAIMTAFPTRWIAGINSAGTYLQLAALFAVAIGVLIADVNRPRFQPSSFAWSIQNGTEWPDGIAVLMSFLTAIWTMSGYDAPFHLSEECSNSQIATPRAITLTAFLGGLGGFMMTMIIAYTIQDVAAVGESAQPFIGWLQQVVAPRVVVAFGALSVITGFLCAQGCSISASRLAFAYARDGVLPASKPIARVNQRTLTPVNAVIFNFIVQVAMLCLIWAGPVAIGAIFSIGAIGAYVAFTVPIALKVFCPGDRWKPGPWTLGRWSQPLGYYSCFYVLLMIPILCFPAVRGADLNPTTMNWTCVVFGGPLLIAAIFFVLYAHKTYTGPLVNVESLTVGGKEYTFEQLQEMKGVPEATVLVRSASVAPPHMV